MSFGAPVPLSGIASTDRFAQTLQPHARPREFDTQNGQPHWDDDDRGPRCHNHHDAQQQYRHADNSDDDPARRPVGEVYDFLDQYLSRYS